MRQTTWGRVRGVIQGGAMPGVLGAALIGTVLLAGVERGAWGAEPAELIRTIQGVGPEGAGSTSATKALRELQQGSAAHLLPILKSIGGSNALAANYLRSAAEVIAGRELKAGRALPAKDLLAFLQDETNDPRARRFAFELLVKIDPANREKLVPGFINDPSTELRREAVAELIATAEGAADKGDAGKAKDVYSRAMAAARDEDQVEVLVKKLGEMDVKVDLPRHFGFLMNWKLLGPFDNKEKKGFHTVYPPEQKVDFEAEAMSRDGDVIRWIEVATENDYGVVDLNKLQAHHKGALTYAAAEFHSEKEQTVDLRLGTPNAWKLWLNGELLFGREEYHRGEKMDQYRIRGTLKKGKNLILIKLCQNEQTEDWAQKWQFQLRVCDATGTAILSADRRQTAAVSR